MYEEVGRYTLNLDVVTYEVNRRTIRAILRINFNQLIVQHSFGASYGSGPSHLPMSSNETGESFQLYITSPEGRSDLL